MTQIERWKCVCINGANFEWHLGESICTQFSGKPIKNWLCHSHGSGIVNYGTLIADCTNWNCWSSNQALYGLTHMAPWRHQVLRTEWLTLRRHRVLASAFNPTHRTRWGHKRHNTLMIAIGCYDESSSTEHRTVQVN